jgi:tetratricopeptide (TPR) repeat protein
MSARRQRNDAHEADAGAFARALACYERGQLEQALAMLGAVLAADPRHLPAMILSGVIRGQRCELGAALEAFDRALAIQPDNASAHFNKANILLLRGEWERGWPHYEWRWRVPELAAEHSAARSGPPLWLGTESLAGKSILLRCEQGLGDTLQFCRYVKWVADRGARVILEIQRPLVSLLADLEGVSQIVMQGSRLPACDYHCPLMTLPLVFGTTVGSVPQPQSYLASDASKVAEWRARLGAVATPRVGLVWRGTATRANDGRRSVPLKLLLARLPQEVQYISLQKNLDEEDARTLREHPSIANHADQLHDFSDTAALCDCLDLVISIDTSVAHLCGALGKRIWILLQFSPAWRWLLDRDDSPWYASARLFRQPGPDDWAAVCERVAAELRSTLQALHR